MKRPLELQNIVHVMQLYLGHSNDTSMYIFFPISLVYA